MSTKDEMKLPLPTGPRPDANRLAWIMSGMPKVGRASVDLHVFDELRAEVAALRVENERLKRQLHEKEDVNQRADRLWKETYTNDRVVALREELLKLREELATARADRRAYGERVEEARFGERKECKHGGQVGYCVRCGQDLMDADKPSPDARARDREMFLQGYDGGFGDGKDGTYQPIEAARKNGLT